MQHQGALTGIKVLDLSRLLPGPYCSMVLADHGAEVLAVEDRRFMADGMFFQDLYRNKRHISLNLKSDEGREIFFKLAKDADVILEGFRPGVVERLGVDYERVRRINPGIIYCAMTGYGQSGPLRDMAGHDVNYLATAGVLDLIGEKGRPPTIPGVQIADIAGAMNGVIGILLALLARDRTGTGQHIDISMTDSLLGFMTLPVLLSRIPGQAFVRSDSMLSHRFACYNTYETADGRYLAVGAVEKRFWQKLCGILQVPGYIDLQYDEARRQEITARFREIFRQKPLSHWDAVLTGADVCCAVVRTLDEVLQESLFLERGMVVPQGSEGSPLEKTLGIAVKLTGTPGSFRTPPVGFGENTREVLRELGYAEQMIEEYYEKGIV